MLLTISDPGFSRVPGPGERVGVGGGCGIRKCARPLTHIIRSIGPKLGRLIKKLEPINWM